MRTLTLAFLLIVIVTANSVGQDTQSTYCNFDDGNQVTAQYSPVVKEQPRNGRVWAPGITLFVQTPLMLGNSEIGLGAYTVYLIPDKKNWTLIVNKNVSAGAAYDASQDVARTQMDVGEISQAQKTLQLTFAHMAAKECSLRIYYQKVGAFADFKEK
jgi:hypothetical protein